MPKSIAVPIVPPETVPITSEVTGEYPFNSIYLVNLSPALFPRTVPIAFPTIGTVGSSRLALLPK